MRRTAIALLIATIPASLAHAASGAWFETEGGRVRLVTTGLPTPEGTLRGALQIDLQDGWKTYWRDPGDAGVPPGITFSEAGGVRDVTIGFPAPEHFKDGDATSAGYVGSVTLPLTLELKDGTVAGPLKAEVFLGICQEICIPLKADLTIDPAQNADSIFDRATVDSAFGALPEPASEAFRLEEPKVEGDKLTVSARLPKKAEADLFLSADGYQFGKPRLDPATGAFAVKILSKPKEAKPGTKVLYTLRSGDSAVDGRIALP